MHTSVLFCKQYKRNKWLMLMACSSWNTEHDPNRMTTGTQELFVKHYWLLIYVSSIFTTSITILDFSMCIFRSFLYFVLLILSISLVPYMYPSEFVYISTTISLCILTQISGMLRNLPVFFSVPIQYQNNRLTVHQSAY